MIKLLDGPAQFGGLMLGRAPVFLRVVVDQDGKIDALDQPDDTPAPTERVYVYEQVEYRGPVHLSLATRPRRHVWTHSATYRHRPDVDGEQLREFGAWRTWALAQPPRVGVTL